MPSSFHSFVISSPPPLTASYALALHASYIFVGVKRQERELWASPHPHSKFCHGSVCHPHHRDSISQGLWRFFMDFRIEFSPSLIWALDFQRYAALCLGGLWEAFLAGSGDGSNKHPSDRWQCSHFTLPSRGSLNSEHDKDQRNEYGKDMKNESSEKGLKICRQHWPRTELWNMKINIYIWCWLPPFPFSSLPYILTPRLFISHSVSLSWVSFPESPCFLPLCSVLNLIFATDH